MHVYVTIFFTKNEYDINYAMSGKSVAMSWETLNHCQIGRAFTSKSHSQSGSSSLETFGSLR